MPVRVSRWRASLHKAFINKPAPFLRKNAYYEFSLIRKLRNRIAHHVPIIRPDVQSHHGSIIKMIEWFCKETADWIESQSRFKSIWNMAENPLGECALSY